MHFVIEQGPLFQVLSIIFFSITETEKKHKQQHKQAKVEAGQRQRPTTNTHQLILPRPIQE
jgi:hypothetical protein